ncbi:MAG: ABC transporter substrate-binding protein [Lentisphaeraceae bacterium]|nr:ABC transporter substrate-binding protein [Lentisphaeraceae bacterium]
MKYFFLIVVFFTVSCSETKKESATDLIDIKLQLNWMPEAEHGGYYEALLKGYFAEEGLNVEIIPGGPGVRVETETALERVQFGIANADKILIVGDKGMKLHALMSPYEKSPRCLIAHASLDINSFAELKKAKVLIVNNTKPYYHWLKYKFPAIENIDTIPYNKATFMSSKNAVIQGYSNSEPLIFQDKGLDVKVLEVSETGFNPYASVLICNENMVKTKRSIVDKMKRASIKGWLSYLKDPQSTNEHIEKLNPSGKGTLNKSTEELKKLMSSQDENFGKMTVERWQELAEQLLEIKLISKMPDSQWDIVD